MAKTKKNHIGVLVTILIIALVLIGLAMCWPGIYFKFMEKSAEPAPTSTARVSGVKTTEPAAETAEFTMLYKTCTNSYNENTKRIGFRHRALENGKFEIKFASDLYYKAASTITNFGIDSTFVDTLKYNHVRARINGQVRDIPLFSASTVITVDFDPTLAEYEIVFSRYSNVISNRCKLDYTAIFYVGETYETFLDTLYYDTNLDNRPDTKVDTEKNVILFFVGLTEGGAYAWDTSSVGERPGAIFSGGQQTPIHINVVEDTASLTFTPTVTTFVKGSALDLSGATAKLTYLSGKETPVSLSDCAITGYDPQTVGEQTITVTYGEYTTTFTVTVVEPIETKYTITFLIQQDGAEPIQVVKEVSENTRPEINGADYNWANKVGDKWWYYTFEFWQDLNGNQYTDDNLPLATANATYQWGPHIVTPMYQMTWEVTDDTTIIQYCEPGERPIMPEIPEIDGYVFKHWECILYTGAVPVPHSFEANGEPPAVQDYDITFKGIWKRYEDVEVGVQFDYATDYFADSWTFKHEIITVSTLVKDHIPDIPKQFDGPDGRAVFVGWEPAITDILTVSQGTTFRAQYEIKKVCTVKYISLDENGEQVETSVRYYEGETLSAPDVFVPPLTSILGWIRVPPYKKTLIGRPDLPADWPGFYRDLSKVTAYMDDILYIQYTPIPYEITLKTNMNDKTATLNNNLCLRPYAGKLSIRLSDASVGSALAGLLEVKRFSEIEILGFETRMSILVNDGENSIFGMTAARNYEITVNAAMPPKIRIYNNLNEGFSEYTVKYQTLYDYLISINKFAWQVDDYYKPEDLAKAKTMFGFWWREMGPLSPECLQYAPVDNLDKYDRFSLDGSFGSVPVHYMNAAHNDSASPWFNLTGGVTYDFKLHFAIMGIKAHFETNIKDTGIYTVTSSFDPEIGYYFEFDTEAYMQYMRSMTIQDIVDKITQIKFAADFDFKVVAGPKYKDKPYCKTYRLIIGDGALGTEIKLEYGFDVLVESTGDYGWSSGSGAFLKKILSGITSGFTSLIGMLFGSVVSGLWEGLPVVIQIVIIAVAVVLGICLIIWLIRFVMRLFRSIFGRKGGRRKK